MKEVVTIKMASNLDIVFCKTEVTTYILYIEYFINNVKLY